ncbi:MAG: replicative helicase loader/inhibitor [Casimicrobiaceae bacterium]
MANILDIAQIVGVISAAYPNWKPTEFTTEVYYQTLQDIPTEELKAATLHSVSEAGRAFAPSVGEIRGAVAELRGMSANVPSSYDAWEEVQRQLLENGGDFGNPVWSHPLIERAMKQMGWRNLRMSENQIADRARFVQCYEQLVDRATRENMLLPEVRGYIEANGARMLAPMDSMKLLAGRMNVRKAGN